MLDCELAAAEMPCETLAPVRAHPSMRTVVAIVAALCGTTERMILKSRLRTHRAAHARQLAMALCWRAWDERASQTMVGRFFGRDHTTVLAAFRAVQKRIGKSEEWSLLHDRALRCLANPELLAGWAVPVEAPPAPPPKIAAVGQSRPRPARPTHPIGPVSQTPDRDPWLSQERRRQRLAVGAEIKSCAQVAKFCESLRAAA